MCQRTVSMSRSHCSYLSLGWTLSNCSTIKNSLILLEFYTIATISVFKPVYILFFKKILDSEFTMQKSLLCSALSWLATSLFSNQKPSKYCTDGIQLQKCMLRQCCTSTAIWFPPGGNWVSFCLSGAYSMQPRRALKEWCLQLWSRCYISPYSWFSSCSYENRGKNLEYKC